MRREDFPVLEREVNGRKLIYFDNAATTQKPRQVISAISEFYEKFNSNVHRGIHTLSQEASELYESAHEVVGKFVGAKAEETIFTRNATEAINLVAYSLGPKKVVATIMEHHSNFIPWQQMSELEIVGITEDGHLDLDDLEAKVEGADLVAVTAASNVLGTINPIRKIAKIAHDAGAMLLVDGAQSVPHLETDFREMGADFLAFSAHKMLGPTGIGALVGRREVLEDMKPFMYGGDMISDVYMDRAEWNDLPWKFEAGTPNIAGGIGFMAAVEYLQEIGMEKIRRHEKEITKHAYDGLEDMGIEVIGPSPESRTGLVSFNLSIHPHDVGDMLNEKGIAVRTGMHCAHPLHRHLGLPGTVRASFYLYNTHEEVDTFLDEVRRIKARFG